MDKFLTLQLMMMKGDVLSGFETLKVCTAYNYKGQTIHHLPYNIEEENVTPIYKEFKGWEADLTGMTTYDELPKELKEYIEFIEKEVGDFMRMGRIGKACFLREGVVVQPRQKAIRG